MMKRKLEVLLVNYSQSNAKDFLEPFKHALKALGYKVVLLKDTEMLFSITKGWRGLSWCFGRGIKGNPTEASPCFKSSDLILLQENFRVSRGCKWTNQRLVETLRPLYVKH